MHVDRKTITIALEIEGNTATLVFRRVKQNAHYKRIAAANRVLEENEKLQKQLGVSRENMSAALADEKRTLTPEQQASVSKILRESRLAEVEYHEAILSSCISCSGLVVDGIPVAADDIRAGNIDQDIAEVLFAAYRTAEGEIRSGSDEKNAPSFEEQRSG
jgi:hypothetical protein